MYKFKNRSLLLYLYILNTFIRLLAWVMISPIGVSKRKLCELTLGHIPLSGRSNNLSLKKKVNLYEFENGVCVLLGHSWHNLNQSSYQNQLCNCCFLSKLSLLRSCQLQLGLQLLFSFLDLCLPNGIWSGLLGRSSLCWEVEHLLESAICTHILGHVGFTAAGALMYCREPIPAVWDSVN